MPKPEIDDLGRACRSVTDDCALTDRAIERIPAGHAEGIEPILFLAYYFPPENTSGASRPGHFVKYLSRLGYSPFVVSRSDAPDATPAVRQARRVPDPGTRIAPVRRLESTARLVERYCLPYNERLPWTPHAIRGGQEYLQKSGARVIISTSPPIAPHLAALWLKARNPGLIWIADLQDPLWGNPFRNRRMAHHYDRAIEYAIFRNADGLVANTSTVSDLWRTRYPQWEHKLHVITNGYDPEDRIESHTMTARNFKSIAHVGALYGGRRPTRFLASIERLMANGTLDPAAFKVHLVGPLQAACAAPQDPPFSTLVSRDCLSYTGDTVPVAEARRAMLDANYLLLLDVNDDGASLQIPAKLYDYLRTGRPVVAFTPPDSPTQSILERSGVPHVCIPPDADAGRTDHRLAEFLNSDPQSTLPEQWFWDEFSAETKTRQLVDIVRNSLIAHRIS